MNDDILAKHLKEADRRSGPAPGVTMEGIRRARRRGVFRTATLAVLATTVVAGGAGWHRSIEQRRQAALAAEVRSVASELAEREERVRCLLKVEEAAERGTVESVRRALSPETELVERAAAANLVGADAAAQSVPRRDSAEALYAGITRRFPGTLAASMAGDRLMAMRDGTSQGVRQ